VPDQRSPAERSLAAQTAAHTRWAREPDRTAATAPARRALDKKFEREVDLDGILSPSERAKRAANARSAYFARAALTAARGRRLAAEARRKAAP
jgi:hypothetical protein